MSTIYTCVNSNGIHIHFEEYRLFYRVLLQKRPIICGADVNTHMARICVADVYMNVECIYISLRYTHM